MSGPSIDKEVEVTPTPVRKVSPTPTVMAEEVVRDEVSINVLNGTGISGAASDLKDELADRDKRNKEHEKLTHEMSIKIEEKEDIIYSIRQGLENIRNMGDDGAEKWQILEALEHLNSSS